MTVRPLLALILMILCAAPVSAAVVSRVVAVVNGEIVTSLQLEAAVRERQLAEGVVALAPTARMAGLAPTPDDFLRLRTLEADCLKAWSEARS